MAGFPQSNIDWSKYMEGLVSKANIDLDNLSEVGEAKLRESGGGGLEILDIGIAPFGINESENKRRYLNGQTILQSQFPVATEKIKSKMATMPSLFCTNGEFEAELTMSDKGQCGKFVVDDSNGTIRLPKVINIQGLFDLQNAGLRVEAGLPNITGELGNGVAILGGKLESQSGALKRSGKERKYNFDNGEIFGGSGLSLDASLSSPIYGKSATVQEEAIQYPYFIQVATGATEKDSVINEYQLNNPYSLLDCKWSDHKLSNISWLLSEGQWNNGAVYVAVYDLLVKEQVTPTIEGLSVKKSDEVYTDFDFVINTSNQTFRLPIKTKIASGGKVRLVTDTIYKINGDVCFSTTQASDSNTYPLLVNPKSSKVTIGPLSSPGPNMSIDKTNLYADLQSTTKEGLYLYYYVGETVQNANLIDAGRIEENKANIDLGNITKEGKEYISGLGMPSTKFTELSIGANNAHYTAPANGWVFFQLAPASTSGSNFITLINITKALAINDRGFNDANFMRVYIPVAKNDEFHIGYYNGNVNFKGNTLKFIYAEGSKE